MEASDSKDDKNPKKDHQEAPRGRLKEFLGFIWRDIRENSRTAKFWLELLAVSGGIFYAIITFCMWSDSHKNFIVDEQAFLAFSGVMPANPQVGEPIFATISGRNIGKTSAKRFLCFFRMDIFRN